jgi:hypothetical protein
MRDARIIHLKLFKDHVIFFTFSPYFTLLLLHISFLMYLWHPQAITRVVLGIVSLDFSSLFLLMLATL